MRRIKSIPVEVHYRFKNSAINYMLLSKTEVVALEILVRDEVSDPGRWNGKCGRCGAGTYTGFLNVEHEGVCK